MVVSRAPVLTFRPGIDEGPPRTVSRNTIKGYKSLAKGPARHGVAAQPTPGMIFGEKIVRWGAEKRVYEEINCGRL